ncbi:MAG: hypothetical protein KI790_01760 [Cyclobacteriaceae bacterium]|nr:hypothetical protein [Cyclobacteriaceae bacterium HetDA_MAG_MS6]
MKQSLILFFVAISWVTAGQQRFGIMAGINKSTITYKLAQYDSSPFLNLYQTTSRPGAVFGYNFYQPLFSFFEINTAIIYQQTITEFPAIRARQKINFMKFPVGFNVNFPWRRAINLIGGVGVYQTLALSGKATLDSGFTKILFEDKELSNATPRGELTHMKRHDMGIFLNLGIKYRSLEFAFRLSQGLRDLSIPDPRSSLVYKKKFLTQEITLVYYPSAKGI